jgi:hypothetical protein
MTSAGCPFYGSLSDARARRDAPDQNQIGSNRLPSDWTSGRSRGGSCARTGTRQYVRTLQAGLATAVCQRWTAGGSPRRDVG